MKQGLFLRMCGVLPTGNFKSGSSTPLKGKKTDFGSKTFVGCRAGLKHLMYETGVVKCLGNLSELGNLCF